MHRNDMPERDQGGLSTEDLARSGDGARARARDDESAVLQERAGTALPERERGTEAEAGADAAGGWSDWADAAGDRAGDPGGREPATPDAEESEPLLRPQEAEAFRSKWHEIQTEFVDDPEDAVHAADRLVAEVMQSLATTFAAHKEDLEGQWKRGEEVATEDLRVALQHYRSFCNRLLTT